MSFNKYLFHKKLPIFRIYEPGEGEVDRMTFESMCQQQIMCYDTKFANLPLPASLTENLVELSIHRSLGQYSQLRFPKLQYLTLKDFDARSDVKFPFKHFLSN